MRRSLFISALLLMLASAVCWAQRGGGGHTGGGARMGGGFGARGAMRSSMGASFAGARHAGFHGSSSFHGASSFQHPHHGPTIIIQHRRFDGHRFVNRSFYPYYSMYPAYYGGLWNWDDAEYDARFNNNYDDRYQTAAEVNRLADEVQQLREERDYTQGAAQPAPAPQAPPTQAKAQEDLPVVVVFLDKHIREVKNYAVANEMLVVLDGNKRTKFPLADIDLAATMKLNDERGVDFEIPNPVMNQ
jgi:hypothetical protein